MTRRPQSDSRWRNLKIKGGVNGQSDKSSDKPLFSMMQHSFYFVVFVY